MTIVQPQVMEKKIYIDRNIYEGEWKNGLKDGKGTMFYFGKYVDDWKNDIEMDQVYIIGIVKIDMKESLKMIILNVWLKFFMIMVIFYDGSRIKI